MVALSENAAACQAIRQRQYLAELLRSTCKHLHSPEACMWCIEEQLDTAGPEASGATS